MSRNSNNSSTTSSSNSSNSTSNNESFSSIMSMASHNSNHNNNNNNSPSNRGNTFSHQERSRNTIGGYRALSQPDLHNIIDNLLWRNSAGQQLSDNLWKEFKSSIQGPQDKCNENLKKFVVLYNPQYEQWNKELTLGNTDSKSYSVMTSAIPILDRDVGGYLSGRVQEYILQLSKALTNENLEIPDGIHLICLVNILSRQPGNNQTLRDSLLTHTLQAGKLAYYKLTQSRPGDKWWPYLHVLLANCCLIIANFVNDKVFGWHQYVKSTSNANNWENSSLFNQLYQCHTSQQQTGNQSSSTPSIPSHFSSGNLTSLSQSSGAIPTSPGSPGAGGSSSSINNNNTDIQKLLGPVAVPLLLECLQFINTFYAEKQPKDFASAFRLLVIETLGSLFYLSSEVRTVDLKIILSCIGRKPYIHPKKSILSLDKEFTFQLCALRILKEIVNSSVPQAKAFIELKGFQKIEDFIMWTTELFQPRDHNITDEASLLETEFTLSKTAERAVAKVAGFDSLSTVLNSLKFTTYSSETTEAKSPAFVKRSRVPQLVQLFQVLYSFTFTSESFSKFSLSTQMSGSMIFTASPTSQSLPANLLADSVNIINEYKAERETDQVEVSVKHGSENLIRYKFLNISPNANSNNDEDDSNPTSTSTMTTSSGSYSNISPTSSTISMAGSGFYSPNSSMMSFATASTSQLSLNKQPGSAPSSPSHHSSSNYTRDLDKLSKLAQKDLMKYVNNLIIEMLVENMFKGSAQGLQTLDAVSPDVGVFHSSSSSGNLLATSNPSQKDFVLQAVKGSYPELQLMVIEYLGKIVSDHDNSLNILRKYFVYQLLLSDYFYSIDQGNHGFLEHYTPSEDLAQQQLRKRTVYLFNSVRLSTLAMIQFFATHKSQENIEEVMVLLEYLSVTKLSPHHIIEIVQVLIAITKCNPANTIKSLIKLEVFSQLSTIIRNLLQENTERAADPLFQKARNILFSFLGQLINNEELSVYAVQEIKLLETLFMLLKSPETKIYAQTKIFDLMKLNPLDPDSSMLDNIYNMYISQFTLIRHVQPMSFCYELITTLLDGIKNLVRANPKKQSLFKKFAVFLNIVTIINTDCVPKEKVATLCHSVLRTIIILLSNNQKIKNHFKNHIGYDTLKDVITKSEEPVSETTMNIIFDMIVDGEFDKEENYLIQNSDAVLLLFNLLCHFKLELQHKIIDTFIPIVEKCTTNQSICCNCHLIYSLMEAIHKNQKMEITEKILNLIQQLGYHSVTVRELKKLFGLLKSDPFNSQLISSCLSTLSTISTETSKKQGPQVYFDFDGKDSCIQLPTFDKWPFQKGFTFSTWVRIESFIDPTGRPEYRPRLFSFLSDSGCGIEVLFHDRSIQALTVSNSVARPVFSPTMNPPSFEEREWYFVCVVYFVNLISSNELRIYIDGQLKIKAPLKLSFSSSLMNNFKIGNNCAKASGERSNPLYGQMGAFNIFNNDLSPNQIQSIYSIGPNFQTSVQDTDGPSPLTAHLFLNYNCRAIEGDLCLDNTPDVGDRNYDATLVSINPCVSRDIKDIIYCLGGIRVLFPLILQISQNQAKDQEDQSASLTFQVLALFKDMLSGSDANQEEMLRCKGFQMMGYLLEKIQPENLTVKVLYIFQDMTTRLCDPDLVKHVYNFIFLDFRIWIKAKYEVQKALFNMIKTSIHDKYEIVRDLITVQKILDIMADFYWYEIPRQSQSFDETFSDSSSNTGILFQNRDILLKRPQISDITDIRKTGIFEILRHLLRNPSAQDVAAIARFLTVCLDSKQLIEMMQFILELLNSYQLSGNFQFFYEELVHSLGAIDIFLTLLRKEDESVRMSALQLISKIHYLTPNFSNCSKDQQYPKISLRKTKICQDSIVITRSLQLFPLTLTTYRYLLSFTMGFNFTPLTFNTEPDLDELSLGANHNEIKHPEVLNCILQLLACAETTLLRQQILQDLKLLIVNSPVNRSSWILIDKWPDHLFSIINDAEVQSDVQYSNVSDLIIDIMKILSIHSFHEQKPGYKTLELVLATLRPYGDRGVLDYTSLARTLLLNIVSSIKSEANTLTSDNSSSLLKKTKKPFLENLIHFLILTEEFIFYTPKDDPQTLANSFLPLSNGNNSGDENIISNGNGSMGSNASTTPPSNYSAVSTSPSPTTIPVHNSNLISFFSRLHLNNSTGEWEDFEFINELLELVDILQLLNFNHENFSTSNMQPVTGNLKSVPLMFSSHHPRIILRLTLEIIKENCKRPDIIKPPLESQAKPQHEAQASSTPVQKFLQHIKRLKLILEKEYHSKSDESNQRCFFTLSHLIKSLKSALDSIFIQKAVVPVMKDLLRKLKSMVIENLILRKSMSEQTGNLVQSSSKGDDEISAWVGELTDSSRTVEFCTITVTSPRWMFVSEFVETTSQSHFFNEEKLLSQLIEKRKKKADKAIQNINEKEDEAFNNAKKKADSELKLVHTNLFLPEFERRSILMRATKEALGLIASNWRKIFRSLTNERGPWGTIENSSNLHWKLDKTESFSRMRCKLKRNYKFDEHLNCAINDDINQSNPLDLLDRDSSREDSVKNLLPLNTNNTSSNQINFGEEDSDWTLVNKDDDLSSSNPTQETTSVKEKTIYSTQCEWIAPMSCRKGKFEITTTQIIFTEELSSTIVNLDQSNVLPLDEPLKYKRWPIEQIKETHLRRYLLRPSAIEIFVKDKTNYFFNFPKKNDRNKVYSKINSARRGGINTLESSDIVKKASVDWQQRKISNFDYLMILNTAAGRTYNDLTQYPVFPWVIADYTSEKLDLKDPAIYRNLSKPIGALSPDRLEIFLERYESFDDPNIPKFHYGSHYSSAGIVLYYLVRMEPFTTQYLELQGGRFDHADRMFNSIEMAWRNSLTSTTDVKELIPEFFYQPEFLVNSNNFNLGVRQDGKPIGDIILPPWAKTPEDFIRINREALESEHVSSHLHEWIDLIFGYKQKGKQAEEVFNVFYYLTYEGSVNIDLIDDENTRKATEAQINNFGQTPTQLFPKKPHPHRELLNESQVNILKLPLAQIQVYLSKSSKSPIVYCFIPEPNILLSYLITDRITLIDRSRNISSHKWSSSTPNQLSNSPFTFESDPNSPTKKRFGLPFANDVVPSQNCFAITNDGRYVISCGHWDNSFKLSQVDSSKLIQSVVKHKDSVTCLALASDGQILVTGSKDTTVMVWKLAFHKNGGQPIEKVPTHILYGHDDEITCVDVNVELDISISGSKDGTCIIHNLRHGEYIRSITLPKSSPISLVSISNQGDIIIYSQSDLMIYHYTINGKLLRSIDTHERLYSMIISKDSEYLITGGERGTLGVRTLFDLKSTPHKLSFNTPVHSLTMSSDQRHLMVGLADGRLGIICRPINK